MHERYIPSTVADYHGYLVSVLFNSPDRFTAFDDKPVDQQEALRAAFDVLQETFPLVDRKLKDPYLAAILRELLVMAYGFFAGGDDENGRYALQEVEGSIWPSRQVPPRHAPAAEHRVHGRSERYAGVTPSPFPRQGTIEDMGHSQLKLFKAVLKTYDDGSDVLLPAKEHYWLLDQDGVARRFSARSRKAAMARFSEALTARTALAALHAVNVFGSLLVFDVEEAARPRVSVRGKPAMFQHGTPNYIVEEANWTGMAG
ncbi:hypothetical protein [Pseudoduganella buxea]|uniref:Uncharacterized protein n=1 Tax=Pseudoduganella buxea TaxID=1949069 RepID=A0A6I3T5K9_9BURK|nr:hypothetical protein [Pseudoduganella buxea]MTV56026.1 hypothetical protein [Pseudoduganella buxea]GGB94741.1 hypothetical protein GCM10011572_15870 [Pseudoduganella buxea]